MLNDICKIAVIVLSALEFTHAWQLVCYCGSYEQPITIDEDNVELFTDNEACFKLSLPTIMYTFGYKGGIQKNGTASIMKACIALHDRNVCALDWTEEASEGIDLINFPVVSLKALAIGRDFGDLLIKLSDAGLNLDSLHLVAHSLGAHMFGETGRKLIEKGKVIPRKMHLVCLIILASPASILRSPSLTDQYLHDCTNVLIKPVLLSCKKYGMETPTGTIDFYPNYGENVQPGCKEGIFKPFTPEDLCSHDRSRDLLIQALSTPHDLQASRAPDYNTWVKNNGTPIYVTTIGDEINTAYAGLYYLTTFGQAPYGMGADGLRPPSTKS